MAPAPMPSPHEINLQTGYFVPINRISPTTVPRPMQNVAIRQPLFMVVIVCGKLTLSDWLAPPCFMGLWMNSFTAPWELPAGFSQLLAYLFFYFRLLGVFYYRCSVLL